MTLERKHTGIISLPKGTVDITDPFCGKKSCRRTTVNVVPGLYDCYAYEGPHSDWGDCIWINQIVCAEPKFKSIAEDMISQGTAWNQVGEIDVITRLAGFFDEKPDFSDEQWYALCEKVGCSNIFLHNPSHWEYVPYDSRNPLKTWSRDGFCTNSGIAEGIYEVYAIEHEDQIIALEIRFQ